MDAWRYSWSLDKGHYPDPDGIWARYVVRLAHLPDPLVFYTLAPIVPAR